MPTKFIIISYYEHITGVCDVKEIAHFATFQAAQAYFKQHAHELVDENPIFYTIVEEKEDGFYYDMSGNQFF